MNKLIERWKALPKWQKFVGVSVTAWAVIWVSFGALAAMSFAIGVFGAFFHARVSDK